MARAWCLPVDPPVRWPAPKSVHDNPVAIGLHTLGKSVTAEASRARDGPMTGLLRTMSLPNGKLVSACPQKC